MKKCNLITFGIKRPHIMASPYTEKILESNLPIYDENCLDNIH